MTRPTITSTRDATPIFTGGDLGEAHARAHEALERAEYARGRDELAAFLHREAPSGSRGLHLYWHLVVFELALENSRAALEVFERHLQPAAAGDSALVDVPQALWRLELAQRGIVAARTWRDARSAAARGLSQHESTAYKRLHHVLTLAGARDIAGLDAWLAGHGPADAKQSVLHRLARGLRSFVLGDFDRAAHLLAKGVASIRTLGGSRAQNDLFRTIRDQAIDRIAVSHAAAWT